MGARFSATRDAYQRFQDAKADSLALGERCIATGIRSDDYELALEKYTLQKNICRVACIHLAAYYTTWMHHAKMLLIILRNLEEHRSRMNRSMVEIYLKLMRHRSEILNYFKLSDALSTAISQVLADFDFNQDLPDTDSEERKYHLQLMLYYSEILHNFKLSDGLSMVVSQVLADLDHNQDLPDTDSEERENHWKLVLHYSEILHNFEPSDAVSKIVSEVLADLDLNGDENGEAIEDDTAAAEGTNEHNQDLPDTDSDES